MEKIEVLVSRCRCLHDSPHGVSVLRQAAIDGHEIAVWNGERSFKDVRLLAAIYHPRAGVDWGLGIALAILAEVPILPVVRFGNLPDFEFWPDWKALCETPASRLLLPRLVFHEDSEIVPGLKEALTKLQVSAVVV
jgi:hypothetical protein